MGMKRLLALALQHGEKGKKNGHLIVTEGGRVFFVSNPHYVINEWYLICQQARF